jgi:Bacterial Ig domain
MSFGKIRKWLLLPGMLFVLTMDMRAQTVSFNFTASPISVSGWVNVSGDPSTGLRSVTANGITVNSVATTNWSPYSGISAQNGNGFYPGKYFPSQVMSNNWFQYNGSARSLANYNAAVPQLQLSGMNPDSSYILRMSGSDDGGFVSSPTVYTISGATVYSAQSLSVHNDSSQGVTFTGIYPNASGVISIYVNTTSSTDIASICGLEVFPGNASVGLPAVALTSPTSGTIVPEGVNVNIQATASETGATISKVEFYADTAKIGEVDAAPYNFTWVDPDPGSYTITAKATDNVGTINNAVVYIGIRSLNYFWSTTGNVGNNADSTFIGNVDSVRLDFRTKDIQRMSITAAGNIGIGTIAPTARLHTTGSVRLAGLKLDSAGVDPRIIVSDSNGNLAYRGFPNFGPGLGQTASGALALGDSISGAGPHSFSASRYQYLNGYQYSFGGSVNDPVNVPDFRIYDNGDLTSGTTMDRSVNTINQTGIRYYSKLGTLELGASDRLDTTLAKIIQGSWPGSALVINTDDSNRVGGKLLNSVYLGDDNVINSTVLLTNSLLASEGSQITATAVSLTGTILSGDAQNVTAPVDNSIIAGLGHTIGYPLSGVFLGGFEHTTIDTARYSLIAGAVNQFGGLAQLSVGQYLVNRTPGGAALGNSNVNFTSLPYTGTKGVAAPGMAGYPLLAIGNSSGSGSIPSNAITVLYNGRTQINTTGYTNILTQTAVTPKAALEVVSTSSGVLLPKLTTAQVSGIVTADLQNGLLLYNTDAGGFQFYNGSSWGAIGVPGSSTGEWVPTGNSATNPSSNFIGTTDMEGMVFRTNDTARVTILAGGAVGIGTLALPQPDARLAVNGTVYAKKILAIQTGWPDYVFNKDYVLPSLVSVGLCIRRNHQLPGMPSAREAAENGIDLGDNQAALLKKIEELTLYLIDVQKKRAERQQEIDRLKDQDRSLADHQREIDQLKETLQKLSGSK